MLSLGTKIPSFNLPNVMNNKTYSEDNLSMDLGTVIMIICNHCPYVIHYHDQIQSLVSKYQKNDIQFVAISSNDVINYPQDSPEKMNLLSYEGLVGAINATNSCDIIEFSTPSLFDLDNVYSKLDLSNEKNFISYIMNERNDTNVKKSFRDFLQENQLGSFARVAIKKIK